MPVRRTIHENNGVYFITFTCARWLPLFQITNAYDLVYQWFDVLKKQGHFIIGYVIMSNHVHAIIAFKNTSQTINTIVGNGKRVMSYDIVKRLQKGEGRKFLFYDIKPCPYLVGEQLIF